MLKNTASQKLQLFAFDSATGLPKTGDAANITASVSIDSAAPADLADTTATEKDSTKEKGIYEFDLAQAETNGEELLFTGRSATAGIAVVPRFVKTVPANFGAQKVTSAGYVAITLADMADPSGNSAKDLGILWYGTLAGITNTSITLPGGHNLDHQGNYAIRLMSGTNAFGKARFLTYSGAGEVWTVDPSWISDSETAPSGTIVAVIVNAEKIPTATLPNVNTAKIAGQNAVLDANNLLKVDAEDWKGATAPAMTGDAFARLGAPAGASVSADMAAVLAKTPDSAHFTNARGDKLDNLDTAISAIPAAPSAASIASTVLASTIDDTITLAQILEIVGAAVAGNLSGAGTTTITIKNAANTKTVITATVDVNGNRTITLTP